MNLDGYFEDAAQPHGVEEASFSDMALGMASSRILVIAYAVRARIEAGADVANFTVGDFKPSQFQIPGRMQQHIVDALVDNQTNYPPAHGTPELRAALRQHYKDSLGLEYPESAFIVGSGARPILYAAYRCLLNPGEVVLTPAPSWNNKNFCHLVGARHINVPTQAADGFMPTADALRPYIKDARLLVLCSPMNPAGTMMTVDGMREITDLIVAENQRRLQTGSRLLYVIYDQVYRMLTFGDNQHVTPVQVAPEMARYTLFTDAVSKGFAGTGLRVGWLCGPPFIAARIKALMTHMGAWAPRPEQIGTAAFLLEKDAIADYLRNFKLGIRDRLDRLYGAFSAWKKDGLPIDVIPPQGAIYLSVRFDLEGRPGLPDEDAVLTYLLEKAGCAVVPFSAFGDTTNKGWVRFSVGAVSVAEIDACLPRLRTALENALIPS
ncbi:MAG: pyridoxal phosphate-dependent aminotransferase [Myxococcota bacterium]|nr:pyridoxal phosphate-dependent aminotransferase [Myxococcota bacterium]